MDIIKSENTAECVHSGHRERLRETFRESGAGALHEHQLLELLLTYAIPRRDVNPLAHSLIQRYGSLYGVLHADVHELEKNGGVGESTASLISLAGALSFVTEPGEAKSVLNTPADAMEYCRRLLAGERYEAMYVISLNNKRTVLHADRISGGTLTETMVYPRLAVECALRHKAASVILAHNHPSGDVRPSKQDIRTTELILGALSPIGISVYDHVITSADRAYSMVRDEVLDARLSAALKAAEPAE